MLACLHSFWCMYLAHLHNHTTSLFTGCVFSLLMVSTIATLLMIRVSCLLVISLLGLSGCTVDYRSGSPDPAPANVFGVNVKVKEESGSRRFNLSWYYQCKMDTNEAEIAARRVNMGVTQAGEKHYFRGAGEVWFGTNCAPSQMISPASRLVMTGVSELLVVKRVFMIFEADRLAVTATLPFSVCTLCLADVPLVCPGTPSIWRPSRILAMSLKKRDCPPLLLSSLQPGRPSSPLLHLLYVCG